MEGEAAGGTGSGQLGAGARNSLFEASAATHHISAVGSSRGQAQQVTELWCVFRCASAPRACPSGP